MTQILPNMLDGDKRTKGVKKVSEVFTTIKHFVTVSGIIYLVYSLYFTTRFLVENLNIYFNK